MNHLRVAFAPYWQSIQHALFPQLERVLGPLTEKQQQLVQTLEVIRIEQMIPSLLKCVWVAAAPVLCLHSRGTASRSTRRASGSHRRDARSPAACC